ncbi:purine nucleosidase [Cytobacillus eiseniae]|uniref:Purine nucleosidase n=1 Tax=Cytobacillus eiseniae TaxID=762947 RepID=A0ABS4RFZ1_9BACI|nr:nucleoside hydrolase [Cytobacillus eiseniae]MBP2241244.1 purine nucleosidase [Cytobacillus eiseniae]
MKSTNILLFGDFGIDDFVAVIFSFFSEKLNVVGIVAEYGNVSKEDALKNAAFLQSLTGTDIIPTFGGAGLPLTGVKPPYYPEVHGFEGLGPFDSGMEVNPNIFENFNEIVPLIEQYKNDLVIVNIGRLSSLATAFILYPNLMKSVNDFYIMGGAFNVPGNVTPIAEANFYGDPYAAKILINEAPKKIHIIPLDVTMSAIITPSIMDSLHEYYLKTNNQAGLVLRDMVDYYYSFYKTTNPGISGSPLHDVFTLWAIQEPTEIIYKEVPVQVVVDQGIAFGQSIGDFRKVPDLKSEEYKVHKVAVQFNYSSFIKTFYETMKNEGGKMA